MTDLRDLGLAQRRKLYDMTENRCLIPLTEVYEWQFYGNQAFEKLLHGVPFTSAKLRSLIERGNFIAPARDEISEGATGTPRLRRYLVRGLTRTTPPASVGSASRPGSAAPPEPR